MMPDWQTGILRVEMPRIPKRTPGDLGRFGNAHPQRPIHLWITSGLGQLTLTPCFAFLICPAGHPKSVLSLMVAASTSAMLFCCICTLNHRPAGCTELFLSSW